MNPIPATITHVSDRGVQATYLTMEKPSMNLRSYPHAYIALKTWEKYLASEVTAWVENVEKNPVLTVIENNPIWYWVDKPKWSKTKFLHELKLDMSCQVIETGGGKCKIVELN